MWLGDGLEVDYDEVKRGVEVTIDAVPDDEGDWIIVKIEPVKPKPTRRAAKPKPKPKPRARGGTSRRR
jgi:hypothetical protein